MRQSISVFFFIGSLGIIVMGGWDFKGTRWLFIEGRLKKLDPDFVSLGHWLGSHEAKIDLVEVKKEKHVVRTKKKSGLKTMTWCKEQGRRREERGEREVGGGTMCNEQGVEM